MSEQYLVVLFGSAGTVFVILFVILWAVDSLRAAAAVVGGTLAVGALVVALIAFWYWVASLL